jgi:eukaryotic-like serine/threonine-protein kinase
VLAVAAAYRFARSPANSADAHGAADAAAHDALRAPVVAAGSAAAPQATAAAAASAPADEAPPVPTSVCPDGAAQIAAATFTMGSSEPSSDEPAPHPVTLDGYCIDRKEVTLAQYRACTSPAPQQVGPCGPLGTGVNCVARFGPVTSHDAHPVNCVDWSSAEAYCRFKGGRLPTEAEWEYAARGPGDGYPWGAAEPTEQLCWKKTARGLGPCPSGSYPNDVSWKGVLDMGGNVAEWIRDWYGRYPSSPASNPSGPDTGTLRVLRGGSWRDELSREVRATRRRAAEPSSGRDDIGFRCVYPAKPAQ